MSTVVFYHDSFVVVSSKFSNNTVLKLACLRQHANPCVVSYLYAVAVLKSLCNFCI